MNLLMKLNIDPKPENASHPRSPTTADRALATAATEAIEWLTTISPEAIRISVQDGWVTLEGSLNWRHQRDTVNEVVLKVPGVKGVTNRIRLEPEWALQPAA